MMNNQAKRGFTLIELLVVVLIIGILAAVALPQYNKAVRKARFSEVGSTFSSISKGIDMWLVENGAYSDVQFFGTNKTADLDVSIPCVSQDNNSCYTTIGVWSADCEGSYGRCSITFDSSFNADKTSGNSRLGGAHISWVKPGDLGDASWNLDAGDGSGGGNTSLSAEICRWWSQFYGVDKVLVSWQPSNICSSYL